MFRLATRCRAVAVQRGWWGSAIGIPSHSRRKAAFSLRSPSPSPPVPRFECHVCCLCSSASSSRHGEGRREDGRRVVWVERDGEAVIALRSKTEDATALLARCLAKVAGVRKGDLVLLQGAVGSGKSVFCRNFIREVTGNQDLEVASPTYLLRQTYEVADLEEDEEVGEEGSKIEVQHFDLYRFTEDNLEVMLQRAYFDDCLENDVVLIEWAENLPERYQGALKDCLVVSLEVFNGDDDDDGSGVGGGGGLETSSNANGNGNGNRHRRIKLHSDRGDGRGPSVWTEVIETLKGILPTDEDEDLYLEARPLD